MNGRQKARLLTGQILELLTSIRMILPVSFYARPTLEVLEDLIGKVLVRISKGYEMLLVFIGNREG